MSHPLKYRDTACAHCFRLKRKCDHAKPSCSECRRKGAECLPARSRKAGDSITIPLSYLRQLETQLAELNRRCVTPGSRDTCDVGVQTDVDWDRIDPLLTSPDMSGIDKSLLFPEFKLFDDRSLRAPVHCSPDTFPSLTETSFDPPWIDMVPLYPCTSDDTPWMKERYANLYFSVTHREWPFLDEAAWRSWHVQAMSGGQDEWRAFFLQMVYAIGASLSSIMQLDASHSTRSTELYASAMRYYPQVVGHCSMVLQIQASLLRILYALHSPSSGEIMAIVSSVLPFCAAAMAEVRKHAFISIQRGSATGADEVLSEKMFITCYMLNEIILSGWDRPVSAAYGAVDDDMCILGDTIQPAADISSALHHLFQLRKIQASIRRSRDSWPCNVYARHDKSNRSSFKFALDRWRQDIPQNALTNVQCGYLNPRWMQKLYDYSLLILVEGKRDFNETDGTEDIVPAIVDVCLNFRKLQSEGHVMCYTWSALVFQFRAGIMLLYIIWAMKNTTGSRSQHVRQTIEEAISTCAINLAGFVHHWTDAIPYMQVLEFLRQKILQTGGTSLLGLSASVSIEEVNLCLEQLKNNFLHRAVLGMIEDMVYGRRSQQ